MRCHQNVAATNFDPAAGATMMNVISIVVTISFVALFAATLITQTVVLSRLKKYHSNTPDVVGISFNPIVGSFSQIVVLFKFMWYGRYKALGDKTLAIECDILRLFYIIYVCSMIMLVLTRW